MNTHTVAPLRLQDWRKTEMTPRLGARSILRREILPLRTRTVVVVMGTSRFLQALRAPRQCIVRPRLLVDISAFVGTTTPATCTLMDKRVIIKAPSGSLNCRKT